MKSKDQLLLEQAYTQVGMNFTCQEVKHLAEMDRLAIEQLIEEGFGDMLKKAGNAIKGGFNKVKEKMTAGIANIIAKLILGKMDQKGQVDLITKLAQAGQGQIPAEVKQAQGVAKQIAAQPQPQGGAPAGPGAPTQTVTKEAFEANKKFLASILFTEENISTLLESLYNDGLILVEKAPTSKAPAVAPAASRVNRPQELNKLTQEIVSKIQNIYKGYRPDRVKDQVGKWTNSLGTQIQKAMGISAPAASAGGGAAPAGGSGGAAGGGAAPTGGSGGAAGGGAASGGGAAGGGGGGAAGAAPAGGEGGAPAAAAPEDGGFLAKIKNFITKNPKISTVAGIAILGLTLSAFAGVAPVLGPALAMAAKGALVAGGGNVVGQLLKGKGVKEIDWKSVGKTAAVGGAAGGIGSVLATGLGNIAGMFDTVTMRSDSSQYSSEQGYGETHKETTYKKGLASFTGKNSDMIQTAQKDTGSFGWDGKSGSKTGGSFLKGANASLGKFGGASSKGISDF